MALLTLHLLTDRAKLPPLHQRHLVCELIYLQLLERVVTTNVAVLHQQSHRERTNFIRVHLGELLDVAHGCDRDTHDRDRRSCNAD